MKIFVLPLFFVVCIVSFAGCSFSSTIAESPALSQQRQTIPNDASVKIITLGNDATTMAIANKLKMKFSNASSDENFYVVLYGQREEHSDTDREAIFNRHVNKITEKKTYADGTVDSIEKLQFIDSTIYASHGFLSISLYSASPLMPMDYFEVPLSEDNKNINMIHSLITGGSLPIRDPSITRPTGK